MKKIISTPIFYINAKPHIGHFYSILLADSFKKVDILFKKNSKLITGTDEHGSKVMQAAKDSKMNIQEYCNLTSIEFRKNVKLANISEDDFIRTSEERHKKVAKIMWTELYNRKFITMSRYEGYYCQSDEKYVTQKELIKNDKGEFITNDNKSVEYLTEDSYTLNFNAESINTLIKMIESNRVKLHINQINEVKEYIKSNLFSFTVSRPIERVSWGINIPNDPNHTIYVWFEALLNYITSSVDMENYKELNYDTIKQIVTNTSFLHVIGKDITKFHCYLLPLMLIALDILPKQIEIFTHHHFLVNNIKMSKSINNIISPEYLVNKYTLNAVRYFFISNGPQNKDISVDETKIKQTFNTDIADSLTNLLLRISNKKNYNINDFNNFEGEFTNSEIIRLKSDFQVKINKMISNLENYEFSIVSFNVHSILLDLNKFIHSSEFWKIENKELLKQIIVFTMESIRILMIFLHPFIPDYIDKFCKTCGWENTSIDDTKYLIRTNKVFEVDYSLINSIFIDKN